MRVPSLPDHRAELDPDGPAVSDGHHSLTNTGDVVALRLRNRLEFVVLMFASWRLGAGVTPVNPSLPDGGYSESVDHEVREHGVRVLLVEPAGTKTGFEASLEQPDTPLEVYAGQRKVTADVIAAALKNGDEPAVVAKAIVAAATDRRPKLRYSAGTTARRASTLRRVMPSRVFDKQLRKINRVAG